MSSRSLLLLLMDDSLWSDWEQETTGQASLTQLQSVNILTQEQKDRHAAQRLKIQCLYRSSPNTGCGCGDNTKEKMPHLLKCTNTFIHSCNI